MGRESSRGKGGKGVGARCLLFLCLKSSRGKGVIQGCVFFPDLRASGLLRCVIHFFSLYLLHEFWMAAALSHKERPLGFWGIEKKRL